MVTAKRRRLPLIRYTARDFESIKQELVDFRRRYYSNISKDENEASFDDMMTDLTAYVGDQLSFYLDYSVNESFLDTAIEFNNVLKLGKQLGYKYKGNPTSAGVATFFAIVPANAGGLGPDSSYLCTLKRGSEMTSTGGSGFILNEDVSFSNPQNQVVVARVNESTGLPTSYAVKAQGKIISGRIVEEIITIGDFQKFLRLELSGKNISEIISVTDDEGNEYYEVDYLSQDIVYKAIPNRTISNQFASSLLRPFVVPRRFIVERERTKTFLQFGFGSEKDVTSEPLIDPSTVILQVHGKNYVSDVSFDPTNILGTDKLGVGPSNTKLRITYRTNTADNVNAYINSITKMSNPIVEFANFNSLNLEITREVINSIEVTNEEHIVGDVTTPTVQELKLRIFDGFAAQNRAVTALDYKSFVYSMPPEFGAIKRVNVVQDPDSFKRNLNMYVISEASDGTLTTTNQTIKENLRVWLNQGKMINDTIDILDLKIVNIGIDFVVAGETETNKYEVLNDCLSALRNEFEKKEEGGEPFSITRVYKKLQKVPSVVDVIKVRIYQLRGGSYSDVRFDLDSLVSADGRFIEVPQNVILELKFPNVDIKGAVK